MCCVLITQSRPALCNPMDCSPSGSSVHEIFQTRILEWVAISFSRGSSQPRNQNPGLLNCRQILYQLSYKGSPIVAFKCIMFDMIENYKCDEGISFLTHSVDSLLIRLIIQNQMLRKNILQIFLWLLEAAS